MSLKGALVGFGKVAEAAHLGPLRAAKGFSIAAVVEADADRRHAAAKALPGAKLYPSIEALLSKEKGLDFADIATPPWLHAPLAKTCLEAGLNVLCEKPLAMTETELDSLALAAKTSGKTLFCVHNWKKAPLIAKLKELLDEGAIGEPRFVQWEVLRTKPAADVGGGWRSDPARAGGGIVMDHGWHAFYLLRWLLGKKPTSASAKLIPAAPKEVEATVLADFGGVPAVVHLSWRAPERSHAGVFRGSKGSIEISDAALVLKTQDKMETRYVFAEPLSHGSAHPDWFAQILPDFAAAVADKSLGAEALEEARDAMKLVTLCYSKKR
ncbi:MAG: Gfo/Idh/MocA family oxidoreductase [Elusimicrobia bacterium]|nr:Gfo/Idh/MocA family oxidoreductase [Elusimicrobiota bacterium]